MTEMCKANPCCGNLAVGCDMPIPQENSGFSCLNVEFADQIKAGATSVSQARAMTDLPGLPVPAKAKDASKILANSIIPNVKSSEEAMRVAMERITVSLEQVSASLRPPCVKFAEDVKALEPLFKIMSAHHGRMVVAFLDSATDVIGASLNREIENALS